MSRLIAEAVDLTATRAKNEDHETQLTERWESTQSLLNKVDHLTAVHNAAEANRDRAASHQQRRQELVDALTDTNTALAALEAEAEQAAPALAATTRRNKEAATALAEARSALRSAQAEHRLAIEDRDHLRQKIEVAQLKERHERYSQAAESLSEAEDHLDSATVDDDLVERIQQAHLDHERAKAAADSAAASIETTALSDITVSIDDDEVELPAGEVHRTLVDNEVTLVIPDVAQVRVSAGPDSKDLADRRSGTQQAYQRLCDEAGVADLDKARSAAQQRREALRNREEADKAIQRELRDLTAEALLSKVKGLTKRVDSYPQERSADADLPEDYDTARRNANEMERTVDSRQTVCLACEEAAEKAAEALQKSQVNESVLAARIKDARNSKEHAAGQLAAARDAHEDAVLTAALASAQQQADDADTDLRDSQAELNAADPESLEALCVERNVRKTPATSPTALHRPVQGTDRPARKDRLRPNIRCGTLRRPASRAPHSRQHHPRRRPDQHRRSRANRRPKPTRMRRHRQPRRRRSPRHDR